MTHDAQLNETLQHHFRDRPPLLHLQGKKWLNQNVVERLIIGRKSWAARLGLDRLRVFNVYEPPLRLMAELGLPCRMGENAPVGESVLAGIPLTEAEVAWE